MSTEFEYLKQLVIADMNERDEMGARKYGTQHQHDNGRDHLIDAYQEALDLVCYLRAEIERRRVPTVPAPITSKSVACVLCRDTLVMRLGDFEAPCDSPVHGGVR
jgi:hypothetical protein